MIFLSFFLRLNVFKDEFTLCLLIYRKKGKLEKTFSPIRTDIPMILMVFSVNFMVILYISIIFGNLRATALLFITLPYFYIFFINFIIIMIFFCFFFWFSDFDLF